MGHSSRFDRRSGRAGGWRRWCSSSLSSTVARSSSSLCTSYPCLKRAEAALGPVAGGTGLGLGMGMGLGPGGDRGRCVGAREAAGAGSLGAGRRDRCGEPGQEESPSCPPLPPEPCPGCWPPLTQGPSGPLPALPACPPPPLAPDARTRPALTGAGSWPPLWSVERGRGVPPFWLEREQGSRFFLEAPWAGPLSDAASPRATVFVPGVVACGQLGGGTSGSDLQPLDISGQHPRRPPLCSSRWWNL